MNNLEKYNNVFNEVLDLKLKELNKNFNDDDIPEWDSVTHLTLVDAIEDEFDVMLESDDILEFRTYSKGKEILKNHEVEI